METAPHILVVDDDREIRDLLARFLRKHGFRVDSAADGREMWRQLDNGRFDLVVLDLMLPGEDGLSLCRRLRAQAGPATPVIMLTAIGEEMDRIIGLEMGADDYLAKPFNPRELLARIRAVLRRSGQLPRHRKPPGRMICFSPVGIWPWTSANFGHRMAIWSICPAASSNYSAPWPAARTGC